MTHVVKHQLALDVEIEGREGDKTVHLGRGRANGTESGQIGGKLVVVVGANSEGVLVGEFFGCGRNGDPYAAGNEADLLLEICNELSGNVGADVAAKDLFRADKVLADENIEGLCACGIASGNALCKIFRNEGKNVYAERGREDVALRDELGDTVNVFSVKSRAVANPFLDVFVAAGDVNGITAVILKLLYDRLVDINEGDVPTGKGKALADTKSSASKTAPPAAPLNVLCERQTNL